MHDTLQGKDAIEFLETLIVGDVASLEDRTGTLSVFTNEKGGIIDDSVITKVSVAPNPGMESYHCVPALHHACLQLYTAHDVATVDYSCFRSDTVLRIIQLQCWL